MSIRFNYNDIDHPNRAGATAADPVPTRGTVDGVTAPVGTKPDLLSRDFYRARFFLLFRTAAHAEDVAGTGNVQVWFRDMPEIGSANNVAEGPPAANKVVWVKGPAVTGVSHLEEVVLENVYKRGVYIQVTAIGGGAAAEADVFAASFDKGRSLPPLD